LSEELFFFSEILVVHVRSHWNINILGLGGKRFEEQTGTNLFNFVGMFAM